MARSPRWNIPGATYHVMNRGNRKALIFEDDRDRRRFIRILLEAAAEYGVEILLGCLMGNHFHLIVLTPHGNLSDFMQQLEGRFAKYVNWRHGRSGHVFQGRFTGVIIENDIHLFIAAWYVFMNPVAAGLVSRPEEWKWSTYASAAGLAPMPDYLSTSWLEVLFRASSLSESQQLLRRCMTDAQPVAYYIQLAEPAPNATIRSYITERLNAVAQPCSYRTLGRPPLQELFSRNQSKSELARTIQVAHERHGYKLAEIAPCVGRHPATVSKIYCDLRREQRRLNLGSDPKFNREEWLKLVPDPRFNVDRARGRRRGLSQQRRRRSRG